MLVQAETFKRLTPKFKQVADVVRVGHNRLDDHDRDDVAKCVIVAVDRLPPGELDRLIGQVRRALPRARPRSRTAYFRQAVANACRDAGVDFRAAMQFDLPWNGTAATNLSDGSGT